MAPEARRAVARGRAGDGQDAPRRAAPRRAEGRGDRGAAPRRDERDVDTPKSWGGVARRGARVVGEERPGTASAAWREAVARGRKDAEHGPRSAPPAWEPEVWVDDDEAAPVAAAAGAPAATPSSTSSAPAPASVRGRTVRVQAHGNGSAASAAPSRRRRLPDDVSDELTRAAGPVRSARVEQALAEAARAYERDRYQDARRLLKPVVERYAEVGAARELYGLTLYRMGKWGEAVKELDAFRTLTGSYDQHPVLMDCHRALGRRRRVDELWEEMRTASPAAEVVTEGRIVMAATIADSGDVRGAIALLERTRTDQRRPKLHHLRVWYALADLYERAGDFSRARELFRAVLAHDREFADVAERLAALA